jgi:hypothetical protein
MSLSSDTADSGMSSRLRRSMIAGFRKLPPPARKAVLHALGKFAPWEEGFDQSPPLLNPGEVLGAPDFVGIGAQKAGTSWWYQLICSHPDVYARPGIHKERHYFDRYAVRPYGPEQSERYRAWFPRPVGRLSGEWTPDYLSMPWVPDLLLQAAPEAKLLVMLRDPVERIASGLAHVRRDVGRVAPSDEKDALIRGFYHEALCWWLHRFPREQILVLQFEQCLLEPAAQIRNTYQFLGLRPFVPQRVSERINPSSEVLNLDEETRRRLVALYRPDVEGLCSRFPEIDIRLWPNFQ